MPIYELVPIDPDDRSWKRSTYCGRVIIRARDEARARQIAKLAFDIAALPVSGENLPHCPWHYENMARCCRLEESRYAENGPEAILEPAEYDQEWKR